MTAKEKLLERVTRLSEAEAEETLRLFEDPVLRAFREAPEDDEPWTDEDEAAAAEADADFAAGRTVSHEEIKRELEIERAPLPGDLNTPAVLARI
jgi:hypothetical protein